MITVLRKNDISMQGNEREIELRGLSTDTKTTEIDSNKVPNGTKFIEMDTGDVYYFSIETEEWINKDNPPTPPAGPVVIDLRKFMDESDGYQLHNDDELTSLLYNEMLRVYPSDSFACTIIDTDGVENDGTIKCNIKNEETNYAAGIIQTSSISYTIEVDYDVDSMLIEISPEDI